MAYCDWSSDSNVRRIEKAHNFLPVATLMASLTETVTETDLSLNCPLYKTKNEWQCECAWHARFNGYDHAMKVLFATERPVWLKRLVQKKPQIEKLYNYHRDQVQRCSDAVLTLQEQLVFGTRELTAVSADLTLAMAALDDATAKFDEVKQKLTVVINRQLEVYYNVKTPQ